MFKGDFPVEVLNYFSLDRLEVTVVHLKLGTRGLRFGIIGTLCIRASILDSIITKRRAWWLEEASGTLGLCSVMLQGFLDVFDIDGLIMLVK